MLGFPQGMYEMARHPIESAKGIGSSLAAWTKPETWKGAPSVLPEALGTGIGNVSAGEAMGKIPSMVKAVPEMRTNLIKATRDPYTQKLLPEVRERAQIVGTGLGAIGGGMLGGEGGAFGGGYAGYRIAPPLTDLLLPKDRPMLAQAKMGAFMNKGYKPTAPPAEPEPLKPFANVTAPQMAPNIPRMGNPTPEVTFQPTSKIPSVEETAPTEAAALRKRLSPLIFENEAQAAQVDALNKRLANEASKAGMYSAARGAVSRAKDYQERIANRK